MDWWIVIVFFFVALIYSSVGFGGGSTYIALLLLIGLTIPEVRITALVCNIIVVSGNTIRYARNDMIPYKDLSVIIFSSVPLAFLGGLISLPTELYKLFAGFLLIVASALLLIKTRQVEARDQSIHPIGLAVISGLIGFASGVIGIGGGIFLAPILLLIRWNKPIVIAAVSSVFILVNSIAGLAGVVSTQSIFDIQKLLYLGIAVLIGGQIGNHLSLRKINQSVIKTITAILVGFVGIRIILLYFM